MKLRKATGIDSIHPPGSIGIYTDNIARFSDFTVSMMDLKVPAGTVHLWGRGVYLAYNTNRFIREMQGDWLFLMDDDHRFDDDLVMRLLDHNLDVVTAITTKKFPPYAPVLYKNDKEPIDLTGKSGLVEVYACGKPGMLIRRHVLEDIPDPWCEYRDSEMGAEDFDLCAKIRKAGYSIHADLDIPLGHMAPYTAYKTKDNSGNWGTTLALDAEGGVFIPD